MPRWSQHSFAMLETQAWLLGELEAAGCCASAMVPVQPIDCSPSTDRSACAFAGSTLTDDRRQLVERLSPAPLAITSGVATIEDRELIGHANVAAPAMRRELDSDHRHRDAGVAERYRHRVADATLGHDIDVVAVLDERLVRRPEHEPFSAADPEVMVQHLRGPLLVARHVPALQLGPVAPRSVDALGARLVRPAHHDGLMDDASLFHGSSSPLSLRSSDGAPKRRGAAPMRLDARVSSPRRPGAPVGRGDTSARGPAFPTSRGATSRELGGAGERRGATSAAAPQDRTCSPEPADRKSVVEGKGGEIG